MFRFAAAVDSSCRNLTAGDRRDLSRKGHILAKSMHLYNGHSKLGEILCAPLREFLGRCLLSW
jgi:hypothetical protein